MFSYRHAFHAGNHADVLKHLVLVATLRHLTQKPTALQVIDTHAGAGFIAWTPPRPTPAPRPPTEFSDWSTRSTEPRQAMGSNRAARR